MLSEGQGTRTYRTGEVGFGQLQQEMIVIGHQQIPVKPDSETEHHLVKQRQRSGAVRCVVRDRSGRKQVRDTGKPYDAASIAVRTRFPAELIQRALDWFSSEEIQWLEIGEIPNKINNPAPPCDAAPPHPAPACENPAAGCLEGKGPGSQQGAENFQAQRADHRLNVELFVRFSGKE